MTKQQSLPLFLALISLLACHTDDSIEADAASKCCPIDEVLHCSGPLIGGTRDLSLPKGFQCPQGALDNHPDGWVSEINSDGCPELRYVGTQSCLPLPMDAGVVDAMPNPDAIVLPGPDAMPSS